MEGALSKWTNVMKGWQYRWFVLDDAAGLFSYYTSKEKMRRGVRRGCVRLRGALVGIDDEDDSTFTVTVDNKTFHFQAKDSEERESWIRALEETIVRHNTLARRVLTRQGGVLDMEDFDKKLGETDCYLQMLITQNSELGLQVETEGGEVYQPLVEKVSDMVETVKHAIVLLQIAKNASCPGVQDDSTDDIARVHGAEKMSDTVEEARENIDSDSRSSNMSTPVTTPASISPRISPATTQRLCVGVVKPPQSHKNSHTIPAVSYSSSDDDEEDFFDAHDDVASKASSDIVPHDRSDQEEKALVSPLTPSEVDWDSLYEDAMEEEEVDMKSHGSVITHLLSQVRIGMDLTKIVLPTFILERRSLLEMYADFFAHPDIFIEIAMKESPEERIIQVLKWYLSAFSASRKTTVAKKPYNPILGEIFRCWYPTSIEATVNSTSPISPPPIAWCSETDLVFLAEQVSHHPPVSAFYAECQAKNISFIGHIYTKSAFLGMSVAVHNIGDGRINVNGEDYVLTFPSAYGRSILTTPWVELGGSCKISCPQTGYNATVEFKTKPFFSTEQNKIVAEVFPPNTKKCILKIEGEWNGKMMAKYSSGKSEVFLDMTSMACVPKEVKSVSEQEKYESRRQWREVTHGLKFDDINAATAAKQGLEQKQRDEAKQRKETGEVWENRLFLSIGEHWHFKDPLGNRKT